MSNDKTNRFCNERKNRIELSSSAWKAEVIATIRLPRLEFR